MQPDVGERDRLADDRRRPKGPSVPETGPVDLPGRGRLVGDVDGGVSHRLVRRCRTAALILLAVAASLLLVVAFTPWNAVSALATVAAGILLLGSALLVKRSALWSAAARSPIPKPEPADQSAAAATMSTIGPARLMSPGLAGAPVKRRLKSSVVPIYSADGQSPGGGALVVHARSDGIAVVEGDSVRAWRVGTAGLESLGEAADGGRFVLYRDTDDAAFLATTRLTDTW